MDLRRARRAADRATPRPQGRPSGRLDRRASGRPRNRGSGRPTAVAAALAIAGSMVLATVAAVRVPAVAARSAPEPTPHAWEPQARSPFPGGPHNRLNIWLSQGEAASQALPREHPAVLFVGDSITQWWTTNGKASWARWFAPLGAADDGVVGDTTSNLLARIGAGQVPPESPRVIVLMIGTNNIALGQSPQDIVRGIETVVFSLHSRMPASRMVVLGLLPRDRPGDPYRSEAVAVNRLLSQAVRPGGSFFRTYISYLDVGPLLLERDGRFRPGVMLADRLHPAASGYALISTPILAAIDRG
ncbi:MAG TPA: GDSL-type esterase/lipase family protein [Acidimicrobiales bacterium]|nr:GDSL-type esterase/lipase family protein [Acidimicrobiales bacterium]